MASNNGRHGNGNGEALGLVETKGYIATIAAAPGWRMTGRSTCTPPGSVAVSTPKSTTPNFRTGRRFEAIVNPECARGAGHASGNCSRCLNAG